MSKKPKFADLVGANLSGADQVKMPRIPVPKLSLSSPDATYSAEEMAAYESEFRAAITNAENLAKSAEYEVDIDLATSVMDMMLDAGGSPKIPNCYAPPSLIELYARLDACDRYVRSVYDYVAECYAARPSGIKPEYVSKHIRGLPNNQGGIL